MSSHEPQAAHGDSSDAYLDLSGATPIFILCAARSGSTLLRYCLDAHPEVASPPETNLAVAVHAIAHTLDATPHLSMSDRRQALRRLCRTLGEDTLGAFARAEKKIRWCDKSLPSVHHAELLAHVYPEAQFICLHRECTSAVVSAIEACPWGYRGYGFEEYARITPENAVVALVRHWIDRTRLLIAFAETHQDRCHVVRFEQLVRTPERTLSDLFAFLNLTRSPQVMTAGQIFGKKRPAGMGDYKIGTYRAFQTEGVDRGWKLPRGLIPAPLQVQADELLCKLGYPELYSFGQSPTASFPAEWSVARDEDGPAAAHSERCLNQLGEALRRNGAEPWQFGVGRLLLADTGRVAFVDVRSQIVRPEWGGVPSFTVATETSVLEAILLGLTNVHVAARRRELNISPAPNTSSDLGESLYEAVTALIEGLSDRLAVRDAAHEHECQRDVAAEVASRNGLRG